jgi:uncharacterized protein YbcI
MGAADHASVCIGRRAPGVNPQKWRAITPGASVSVDTQTQTTVMSNEMRAVIKRLWGRGPEHVRVLLPDEDTVVVLLTGVLTGAERTLLAADRAGTVISQRDVLHAALEPEIRAILETYMARETDAFIPGIDTDRDVASLVVTLR